MSFVTNFDETREINLRILQFLKILGYFQYKNVFEENLYFFSFVHDFVFKLFKKRRKIAKS
jgi:hypothetical protein